MLVSEKGLLPNLALKSAVSTPHKHEELRKNRAIARHECRSTGCQMKAIARGLANIQRVEADQLGDNRGDNDIQRSFRDG